MARINITLSEPLDEQMREYIKDNNLTITTFLHLAISKYLETQEQSKNIKKLFTELLKEEFKNQ